MACRKSSKPRCKEITVWAKANISQIIKYKVGKSVTLGGSLNIFTYEKYPIILDNLADVTLTWRLDKLLE